MEGARTDSFLGRDVSLYDALVQLTRRRLQLSIAHWRWRSKGPHAGLAALEAVGATGGWNRISRIGPRAPICWGVRDRMEARHAYQLAIGLENDPAVREYLRRRCEDLSNRT